VRSHKRVTLRGRRASESEGARTWYGGCGWVAAAGELQVPLWCHSSKCTASYAQPRTGLLPWLYLSTNCALAFRSLNISPMLLQSPPWFRTCSLDATDRRPPIAFQLTQVTRAKSCGLPQEMATARQARRAGRVAVPALARRATAPLPEQPTPRQAPSVRPAKVADVTQSAHHMQPSTSYPALRPAHL